MIKYWLKESWALFCFYRLRLLFGLLGITIGIGAACALCAINFMVTKNSESVLAKYGQSRFIATFSPTKLIEKKQGKQHLNIHQISSFCHKPHDDLTIIAYHVVNLKNEQMIVGTLSGIEKHLQWALKAGRPLHRLDEKVKVAMVGSRVGAAVGSLLNLFGTYVEVIGVLEETELNPLLDFDANHAIFLGFETLARLKPFPWVDSFIVQSNTCTLFEAKSQFKSLMKSQFMIEELFIRDATIFQLALLKQVNMTVQMLKIIAITTLLLGTLSIINLLVILIDERKKEMGLRLAMGATALSIGWQFLREIMMLCCLGAVLGIVFGHIAAYIIVMKLGLIYYFGWFSWIIGFIVAIAMGILAGSLPLIFATKSHPVKLLNS